MNQHSLGTFSLDPFFPVELWRLILQNLKGYQPIQFASVSKLFLNEIVFHSVTSLETLFSRLNSNSFITLRSKMVDNEFLFRFKSLRTFSVQPFFQKSQITNKFFNGLINVTSLNLNYSFIRIDSFVLGKIKELVNLTSINFGGIRVSDDEIKQLTHSNLTSLNLGVNNRVTSVGISRLTQLTSLKFHFNNLITDEGIRSLTNLTALDVYKSNISDEGIKNLTKLCWLKVSESISNEGIEKLTNLTHINLTSNQKITFNGIHNMPKLTELLINNCASMSIDGFENKNILYLDLSFNQRIFDCDLMKLTNLTFLRLQENYINDAGIFKLTNLIYLELDRGSNITNTGIKELTNLTHLCLFQNKKITDVGIKNLTKLKFLNLTQNELITLNGITSLTNLTNLTLNDKILRYFTDNRNFYNIISNTFPLIDFDNLNSILAYYYSERERMF